MAATLSQPLPPIFPSHPTPHCTSPPLVVLNRNDASRRLQMCRGVQDLRLVHGQMLKNGLARDPAAVCKLVSACAEKGSEESLDLARKVLEVSMGARLHVGLFAWNSVIRGYIFAGMGEEAFLLYVQMLVSGVSPDRFTFPFVVNACAKIATFRAGEQVHCSLNKMGWELDVYLSIVCGEMDSAWEVFDKLSERNVAS